MTKVNEDAGNKYNIPEHMTELLSAGRQSLSVELGNFVEAEYKKYSLLVSYARKPTRGAGKIDVRSDFYKNLKKENIEKISKFVETVSDLYPEEVTKLESRSKRTSSKKLMKPMKGDTWVIDHIVPFDCYDLSNEEEFKECAYYKNTRPIWERSNLSGSEQRDDPASFQHGYNTAMYAVLKLLLDVSDEDNEYMEDCINTYPDVAS